MLFTMVVMGHLWLLSIEMWYNAELNFLFHPILIHLNLHSYMWLAATIMDSEDLDLPLF